MANGLTNAVRHEFAMIANDRQTFVAVVFVVFQILCWSHQWWMCGECLRTTTHIWRSFCDHCDWWRIAFVSPFAIYSPLSGEFATNIFVYICKDIRHSVRLALIKTFLIILVYWWPPQTYDNTLLSIYIDGVIICLIILIKYCFLLLGCCVSHLTHFDHGKPCHTINRVLSARGSITFTGSILFSHLKHLQLNYWYQ